MGHLLGGVVWPQIISILCQWEILYPVIWILLANPVAEILFYLRIFPFCLTVGLRVEGSTDVLLDSCLVAGF